MSHWNRTTRHNPCPVCGKPDGCEVSPDGAVVICRRVSDGAFREARNGVGWLHRLKDTPEDYRPPPAPIERTKAPPDVLHDVYDALLNMLTLSPAHLAHLRGPERRLSRNQIRSRKYKTLPVPGRAALARDLADRFGAETLMSVPGFFVSNRGPGKPYLTIAGAAGLLIPFRDAEGRITGLQIRPDGKRKDGAKYVWLSSKGKPGGTGPGGDAGLPAHVSRPRTARGGRLLLTEGPLKADISADILGETVVAVPGVGTWEGAHVPEIVEALDPESVVVAYDADFEDNPRVCAARRALACALVAAGHKVFVATWDKDQGNGLDDLLLNGGTPALSPWTDTGESRLVKIPAAAVPRAKDRTPATLKEARAAHRRILDKRLSNPRPGAALFLESGTGTAKTTALMKSLGDLLPRWPTVTRGRGKTRPMRLAYLVNTREEIEKLRADNPWLTDEEYGRVAVRFGRDAASCRADYLGDVAAFGNSRHSVSINVCNGCPMRDYPCGYFDAVKAARAAHVVLATKSALANSPEELAGFDVVVCDEDLTPLLFEEGVVLDLARSTEWMAGMNGRRTGDPDAYGDDHPHRRLVSLLQSALMNPPDEWTPLVPELARISGSREALAELVSAAVFIIPGSKTHRFDYEEPSADVVPLRLMADLLKLLAEDVSREEGADTRLWLTPEGIRPYLFRSRVADLLRKRTLINLDATPAPVLARLFPGAEHVRFDVPEDVQVVQITDYLLTKRTLEKTKIRARVNAALETITREAERPAVFTLKYCNPDADPEADNPHAFTLSNPAVTWGHFGKDTRALNNAAVMGADVLAVVGLYAHPPMQTRALVQAVRNSPVPVLQNGEVEALKPYEHIGPDDRGTARRVKADPDPDVREAIDSQIAADVVQAIGRARACLRTDGKPLRVFVLTAWPITGLRIDRLTTLEEYTGKQPQPAHLAEMNRKRAEEARNRIQNAAEELRAEGLPVTVRAVRERAGIGSYQTIRKILLPGVLHTHSINTCSDTLPVCNTSHKGEKPDAENGKNAIGTGVFGDSGAGNGKTTPEQAPPVTDRHEVILPKVEDIDGKDGKPPAHLKGLELVDWYLKAATAHLHPEEEERET